MQTLIIQNHSLKTELSLIAEKQNETENKLNQCNKFCFYFFLHM